MAIVLRPWSAKDAALDVEEDYLYGGWVVPRRKCRGVAASCSASPSMCGLSRRRYQVVRHQERSSLRGAGNHHLDEVAFAGNAGRYRTVMTQALEDLVLPGARAYRTPCEGIRT